MITENTKFENVDYFNQNGTFYVYPQSYQAFLLWLTCQPYLSVELCSGLGCSCSGDYTGLYQIHSPLSTPLPTLHLSYVFSILVLVQYHIREASIFRSIMEFSITSLTPPNYEQFRIFLRPP